MQLASGELLNLANYACFAKLKSTVMFVTKKIFYLLNGFFTYLFSSVYSRKIHLKDV